MTNSKILIWSMFPFSQTLACAGNLLSMTFICQRVLFDSSCRDFSFSPAVCIVFDSSSPAVLFLIHHHQLYCFWFIITGQTFSMGHKDIHCSGYCKWNGNKTTTFLILQHNTHIQVCWYCTLYQVAKNVSYYTLYHSAPALCFTTPGIGLYTFVNYQTVEQFLQ